MGENMQRNPGTEHGNNFLLLSGTLVVYIYLPLAHFIAQSFLHKYRRSVSLEERKNAS